MRTKQLFFVLFLSTAFAPLAGAQEGKTDDEYLLRVCKHQRGIYEKVKLVIDSVKKTGPRGVSKTSPVPNSSTHSPVTVRNNVFQVINPQAPAFTLKRANIVPNSAAGTSSIEALAADSAFELGEVYCYPNPAKKTNPTFHIETGLADKVELKIYDTSGDLVHEIVLAGAPQVINDGQGPQYAYEYLWDTKNVGSGVYLFGMTAQKGDKTLKKTGRCAVIK